MRLALGPPQYFWPRERTLAFYREALTWPLDVVYLGETVCSKRRELRLAAGETLIHEGQTDAPLYTLLDGWAFRFSAFVGVCAR